LEANPMSIFEIVNQAECLCNVERFTIGHQVLDINVYDPILEKKYRLTFVGVVFFSGPINWNGVEFEIAAPDECLSILKKIVRFDKIPDEYLLELYKLYKVKNQRIPIEIISAVPYVKEIQD
jgi:hypothetical protein